MVRFVKIFRDIKHCSTFFLKSLSRTFLNYRSWNKIAFVSPRFIHSFIHLFYAFDKPFFNSYIYMFIYVYILYICIEASRCSLLPKEINLLDAHYVQWMYIRVVQHAREFAAINHSKFFFCYIHVLHVIFNVDLHIINKSSQTFC